MSKKATKAADNMYYLARSEAAELNSDFSSREKAAEIIAQRIEKNIGLIAFPWPMRFGTWFLSILPNRLSDLIYSRLPHKV